MKRIEVKLSLEVVAPLLDVIKAVADSLRAELAVPVSLEEIDPDVRDPWRTDLLTGQNDEIGTLLALFDDAFFTTGVIGIDGDNAEPLIRACSAVRLRLRSRFLTEVPDELLESGDVDLEALPEAPRKAFMCYLFLATVQELIIQNLDSSILGN